MSQEIQKYVKSVNNVGRKGTSSHIAPQHPMGHVVHLCALIDSHVEVRTQNEGLGLSHLSLDLVVQVKNLNWLSVISC